MSDIIADLKRDEGFRAKPYRDTEGKLTIGYGTLIEYGISKEEAAMLLGHRLGEFLKELMGRPEHAIYEQLPFSVCRGVENMLYNLGVSRLCAFKDMWAALGAKDFDLAAREALDSKWASQVGTRAVRVAALIRAG